MQSYVDSVRASLESQNWHGALFLTLALPDICASLASKNGETTGRKYARWWDENAAPHFTVAGGRISLGGSDAYALRCSMLHQGKDDTSGQRAALVLAKIDFSTPSGEIRIHNAFAPRRGKLLLQVDLFCEDVCRAVEQWLGERQNDEEIQARIAELSTFLDFSHGAQWG